ncbi:M3 family metallopeptidase, partial [Pantoea ananatis]
MNARQNPFFNVSSLPYHTPPFDQIQETDFLPALQAGMEEKRQEVLAIATNPEAATFLNTCEALEKSGQLLTRVSLVFNAMTSAHTSPYLQQVDEDIAPQLTALNDEIMLNRPLFSRIDQVYLQRNSLDAESKRLVEVLWQRFQLAGANLPETQKQQLKALNQEAARLSTQFTNKLLAATKAGGLVVNDVQQLAGLSPSDLAVAQAAAAARGLENAWLLVLQNTTQQPALQSLEDRPTRQALFHAAMTRSEKNDDNDTRALVLRLAQVRAEQAKLLGFASFAAWQLQDQMAKTPDAAFAFMRNIVPAARARAEREAAAIQQTIDSQQGNFTLGAWDWNFYAEQVRRAQYDL